MSHDNDDQQDLELKPDLVDTGSSTEDNSFDDIGDDDFGFLGNYDDDPIVQDELMLPENTASSAVSIAFVGVGGGGGKLAKAFLDLGFSKTLLVNTTVKDQPSGVPEEHFLLVPGADGVGKDVKLGKEVLGNNSALVEDALKSRIGKCDWLIVCLGGGGGTGSASHILHESFERFLKATEAGGKVMYIISRPTAQELLNPTISKNFKIACEDISAHPHLIIDNEKQLQLLRGKVGLLNMYPTANATFSKLFHQVLKLADKSSPIQTFDSKDLERCLRTDGRMFLGSTVVRDPNVADLGARVFQGCMKGSPCPAPNNAPETGVLLLVINSQMAADPDISKRLETAISYVGGRTQILFSGIYINDRIPGLIAVALFGGMKS